MMIYRSLLLVCLLPGDLVREIMGLMHSPFRNDEWLYDKVEMEAKIRQEAIGHRPQHVCKDDLPLVSWGVSSNYPGSHRSTWTKHGTSILGTMIEK